MTQRDQTIPTGWECPKCGSIYSPSTSSCALCNQYVLPPLPELPVPPKMPDTYRGFILDYTDPCAGCSNHPANGGSGACHCSIPYMTYRTSFTFTDNAGSIE